MDFRLEKHFPLFTAFLWGTTYVATKNALFDFSPMVIAAGRAFFAYLALVIFYLLLVKKEYLKPKCHHLFVYFPGEAEFLLREPLEPHGTVWDITDEELTHQFQQGRD